MIWFSNEYPGGAAAAAGPRTALWRPPGLSEHAQGSICLPVESQEPTAPKSAGEAVCLFDAYSMSRMSPGFIHVAGRVRMSLPSKAG